MPTKTEFKVTVEVILNLSGDKSHFNSKQIISEINRGNGMCTVVNKTVNVVTTAPQINHPLRASNRLIKYSKDIMKSSYCVPQTDADYIRLDSSMQWSGNGAVYFHKFDRSKAFNRYSYNKYTNEVIVRLTLDKITKQITAKITKTGIKIIKSLGNTPPPTTIIVLSAYDSKAFKGEVETVMANIVELFKK